MMDIGDGINPAVEISLQNPTNIPGPPDLMVSIVENGVRRLVGTYQYLLPGISTYIEIYARRTAPQRFVMYIGTPYSPFVAYSTPAFSSSSLGEIRFGVISLIGSGDLPELPYYLRSVAGLDNPASEFARIGPYEATPDQTLVVREVNDDVGVLHGDRIFHQVDNPPVFAGRSTIDPMLDLKLLRNIHQGYDFTEHRAPALCLNRVVFTGTANDGTQSVYIVIDANTGAPVTFSP
jgi:hypothetical protein